MNTKKIKQKERFYYDKQHSFTSNQFQFEILRNVEVYKRKYYTMEVLYEQGNNKCIYQRTKSPPT